MKLQLNTIQDSKLYVAVMGSLSIIMFKGFTSPKSRLLAGLVRLPYFNTPMAFEIRISQTKKAYQTIGLAS